MDTNRLSNAWLSASPNQVFCHFFDPPLAILRSGSAKSDADRTTFFVGRTPYTNR